METIVARYTPDAHPDRKVEVSYNDASRKYIVAIVDYDGASLNPFVPCGIVSHDDLSLYGTRDGCKSWVETSSIMNLEDIVNEMVDRIEFGEDPIGYLLK